MQMNLGGELFKISFFKRGSMVHYLTNAKSIQNLRSGGSLDYSIRLSFSDLKISGSLLQLLHGSLKRPVRSSWSTVSSPFIILLITNNGLLYRRFPVAFSSRYGLVWRVVLCCSFSGNHRLAYLGFFRVFSANFFNRCSLLLDSTSRPASLNRSLFFYHTRRWP